MMKDDSRGETIATKLNFIKCQYQIMLNMKPIQIYIRLTTTQTGRRKYFDRMTVTQTQRYIGFVTSMISFSFRHKVFSFVRNFNSLLLLLIYRIGLWQRGQDYYRTGESRMFLKYCTKTAKGKQFTCRSPVKRHTRNDHNKNCNFTNE